MKTMCFFRNYVLILLLAGLSVNMGTAQITRKESVEKVYDISPSGSLILSSNRANIEILTWDRNEVKIVGELTYKGVDNMEDIESLFKAFKSMDAESSKNVLKLNLTLIVSSSNVKTGLFRSAIASVLCNGDIIISTKVEKNIETNYTIWIPETLDVNVNNKFGKLKISSIKGNANLTLSNNDLEMRDFGGSGIFEVRFSKATIGSGGVSKFNVSNSEINAAELKNVTIDSRFSKFNIAKADDVSLKSNNDQSIVFGMLNNIDATARFSTIHIESNVGKSKFDLNNSKLFGKNFQTMEISSRFSEINIADIGEAKFDFNNQKFFGKKIQTMTVSARFSEFNVADVGETKITMSNNCKYNFATVNTFNCQQSRFDAFKFDEIVHSASFIDTNNTNINIYRTNASLSRFSGNFRFGSVNLKLNPNVEYNLNYNGTFGQLNGVSPDRFKTKYISDKDGSKTTIQGTNAGATCNVEIVANNTTFKIE